MCISSLLENAKLFPSIIAYDSCTSTVTLSIVRHLDFCKSHKYIVVSHYGLNLFAFSLFLMRLIFHMLAIWLFSFMKCLFMSFAQFSIGLSFFSYLFMGVKDSRYLCVLQISSLKVTF